MKYFWMLMLSLSIGFVQINPVAATEVEYIEWDPDLGACENLTIMAYLEWSKESYNLAVGGALSTGGGAMVSSLAALEVVNPSGVVVPAVLLTGLGGVKIWEVSARDQGYFELKNAAKLYKEARIGSGLLLEKTTNQIQSNLPENFNVTVKAVAELVNEINESGIACSGEEVLGYSDVVQLVQENL